MKILIVSATKFEIEAVINQMKTSSHSGKLISCTNGKNEIDFLITGVGMVATGYYIGKYLSQEYDFALNVGICGSFNRSLEIGSVVNIYEDCFSELGAEDGDGFLTLNELNLEGTTSFSNLKSQISNPRIDELSKVNGITVNTTHGTLQSIENVFRKFHPMVESMEGASFMFACENEGVPFAQIRAVSNFVEHRNRDAWNVPLAIENLNKKVLDIINEFEFIHPIKEA